VQNILLECARRDLSNGGVYGVAWVPWHDAQQIFARPSPASWAQRGQISALGLPGAPLIARRCSAIAPEHFATIGGHVGSAGGDLAWRPPSPCPWARPQLPTRHSQACHSAPGHTLCAAITAVPSCTTAELFVRLGTALAAARGGAKAPWVPSMARRPPRGCAAQVHQQALAWRPGKDTEDAPFLGGDPRAICGHHGQDLALHRAHAHISAAPDLLSRAQSEPLRSRLDPLDRE
jgi:hypothetical protein